MRNQHGVTLPEILVALVILLLLSPVAHRVYSYSVKVQQRRAIQEEAILFSSCYMEYTKLLHLSPQTNHQAFDSLRVVLGDTLYLVRDSKSGRSDELVEETFSIVHDSLPIATFIHSIPPTTSNHLW